MVRPMILRKINVMQTSPGNIISFGTIIPQLFVLFLCCDRWMAQPVMKSARGQRSAMQEHFSTMAGG